MIRTLIVDDEPLARDGLRVRLAALDDVAIVGEAHDGASAVKALTELEPDLVFLDIQMPGCDGFSVLEQTAGRHLPEVVFVTAHEQHALAAFDVVALDYLLKPVSEDRFAEAMRRARRAFAAGGIRGHGDPAPEDDRVARLLDWLEQGRAPQYARRLTVRERDRILLLPVEEIAWIEAAGNYAEVHARGGAYLVRTTLADLESRLDPAEFARVHRSTIVRIARVREIRPDAHGDFDLLLDDGSILPLSRSFRTRLLP